MLKQGLQQRQIQQQKLIMTPQMQQAIMLLQLSVIELEQLVEQELEQNPLLDISDSPLGDQSTNFETDNTDLGDSNKKENLNGMESKAVDDINWDDLFPDDRNWESITSFEKPSEKWDEYLSQIKSNEMDLTNYLLQQVRLSNISDEEYPIAEMIIGNIDANGYLRIELDELANKLNISSEKVEQVLKNIQHLDPPGVGARDLRECLLIQCEKGNITNPVVRILLDKKYFTDFEHRRYLHLSKLTGFDTESIKKAVEIIYKLNPKPGLKYFNETPRYISPDVIVQKNNGEYEVYLNDGSIPKLIISPVYQKMLKNKNSIPKEQYEFILEKFRAARNLIKNIERRRSTILMVTEEIMKVQREFLEKGTQYLKTLKLREIADKVNVHESTVARVTSNKYVQTPYGIFELKYFFSTGLNTQNGESVSARSIRLTLKNIIADENPGKPLSDQDISDIFKAKGINIARRTVAKYREQLKILSARMRKREI